MKKLTALLAASALMLSLAACGDFAPDPTDAPTAALDYSYTESTFPDVAGSAAYTPLMEAVTAIMLGTTRENAAEHLNLGATDAAWDALGSGEVGVVVAPEGSSMPSGIDTAPISRDALVFFVGADSPVSDLSSDELRSIFTGREDSWQSYGGDGSIRILTRPEGSGSIAALERLIGCDSELVTGESLPLTGSDVIGFGLWSECELSGLADGYKLLSVDGVEPSADSIRSGEYALSLDVLAGVSSGAAEDSAERTLWLWLQGSVGQAFISSQGYLEAVR
ncbi:MAG TPA: hypothetical protein IAD33_03690 [Candidatus Scatomorpha gallistercoris]|nr:hypothetical protein [Candidatus Scatomorpha gallistercoris]